MSVLPKLEIIRDNSQGLVQLNIKYGDYIFAICIVYLSVLVDKVDKADNRIGFCKFKPLHS